MRECADGFCLLYLATCIFCSRSSRQFTLSTVLLVTKFAPLAGRSLLLRHNKGGEVVFEVLDRRLEDLEVIQLGTAL